MYIGNAKYYKTEHNINTWAFQETSFDLKVNVSSL